MASLNQKKAQENGFLHDPLCELDTTFPLRATHRRNCAVCHVDVVRGDGAGGIPVKIQEEEEGIIDFLHQERSEK